MASYPGAVKTFTTKNAGDTIQASFFNDLQDEVNAIEGGLLNGTAPLNSSHSTLATLSVAGGSTLAGTLQVSGASSFAGAVTCAGAFLLVGSTTITPSTGNTNDFALSSDVTRLRLNVAAGNSTISGFAVTNGNRDGQVLKVMNVGGGNLFLPHTTGSASSNQIATANNAGVTVRTNGGVELIYDSASGFWRAMTP